MRTKTLLTAVAALAATVISSEAQVYSANVVGYANVVIGPGYNLIANPFDDGNGNQLSNILASAGLANKSQAITWNGAGYNTAIGKITGGWSASVSLPPGQGFFVNNSSVATTNTFVGTVIAPTGANFTNVLASSYNLVGSAIPFAGDASTDTNINLINAGLANKSQLISWNPGSQTFNTAVGKITGGFSASFPVTVGQGFFVNNSSTPTNWVQTLNAQ